MILDFEFWILDFGFWILDWLTQFGRGASLFFKHRDHRDASLGTEGAEAAKPSIEEHRDR